MGEVVALRQGGPAEKAGVEARSEDDPTRGDRIKAVKLPEPDGKQTWFAGRRSLKAATSRTCTVRSRSTRCCCRSNSKRWADGNPGGPRP